MFDNDYIELKIYCIHISANRYKENYIIEAFKTEKLCN
jgi:hypothetical protein